MADMYPVPLVGTAVDLTAPAEVLQAYEDVEQALRLLAEAKRQLTAVLVEHSMTTGRRTVTVENGAQYERTGGPVKRYERILELERELLDAGMPEQRVREIVVTTVDRKVDGTQANAAGRANPEYAAIIEGHVVTTDAPFRISRK